MTGYWILPFEDNVVCPGTVKPAGSQCLCGFPLSILAKCLQFFKRNREKTFDKSYNFR